VLRESETKAIVIYIYSMKFIPAFLLVFLSNYGFGQNKIIVFQSDFGTEDGAVSAMKGVAATISPELRLYDLTHHIPPYNIWHAAYRLQQTVEFWPAGTVFVSVVDPGVGTERKSVVARLKSGHFIVTPDNGTLTLVAESLGIDTVREINEEINRRKNSNASYTFHGRDVYAYTAAMLASGNVKFANVGEKVENIVRIEYRKAAIRERTITGMIPILDIRYGNVWTNIPDELFRKLGVSNGDLIYITIYKNEKKVYASSMPFHDTFGKVPEGKPVAYLNSLLQLSFALNKRNFAKTYNISSGNEWTVEVRAGR
jgi:S-adenosylmethionine hydrolase